MNNLNDQDIQKIINQYKNKREREYKKYHETLKLDEAFCQKNKQRALEYYYKNKDAKKEKYKNDNEFIKARSSFQYYKKNNRVDDFISKYPLKCELLTSRGIEIKIITPELNSQNPIILSQMFGTA
tara:strand:+ start:13314 stop:13691 length:378 start_codon:yes stop_codon:yes gene_type:complete